MPNYLIPQVGEEAALELLLGRVDLSQRAYDNLRNIMAKANVFLPPYKKVMDYEKTLDVGEISPIHDARNSCLCKGFSTNFHSTLQKVCDTVPLFRMFSFIPTDKQLKLCSGKPVL